MDNLPPLNKRLKEVINFFSDGNVSDFSNKINVSQPRLNRLFMQDSRTKKIPSVPSEVIININTIFKNIDPDWLLTGKGMMFRSQNPNKSKQLFGEKYKTKNTKNVLKKNEDKNEDIFETKPKVQKKELMETAETYATTNKTANINSNEDNLVFSPQGKLPKKHNVNKDLVPYYDTDFAAGGSIATFEDVSIQPAYYMDIPEFSGCTAFRAYSDSMEKLIKSGSVLFGTKIETWLEHLEYGQIYGIICNDGRRYLKYIRRADKHLEQFLLKSENEDYDDFDMPKSAIRSIWLIYGWLNKRT